MFYIVKFYKPFLLGVSLLLLASGLISILSRRFPGNLKALATVRYSSAAKRAMCLLILLVFFLNCFMISLNLKRNASAEIALNYANASQGLNPNGTRYNQGDILSTDVLQRAIEKGALPDVTVTDLKRTLSVGPLVQGNSENEQGYFISTQFGIHYFARKETAHLDGETLLALVTQSYNEWFVDKFPDNTAALKMDFEEIEGKDYLDICECLRKRADLIGGYMVNMSTEAASFQSAANGETFQSVGSQAYKVSETMVENLEAYVLENSVSKDRTTYMERLMFDNVFKHFDALKAAAVSENNLTAISMYEDDMARIVLVPTYDTQDQFYMSQTRIGIDDFAADADQYANKKTSIRSAIATNSHILEMFSKAAGSGGLDSKAELLIGQIEDEVNRLAEEATVLLEEYNAQKANNYMTIMVHTLDSEAKTLVLNVLAYTLLFAVGLHCAAAAVSMKLRGRKGMREL